MRLNFKGNLQFGADSFPKLPWEKDFSERASGDFGSQGCRFEPCRVQIKRSHPKDTGTDCSVGGPCECSGAGPKPAYQGGGRRQRKAHLRPHLICPSCPSDLSLSSNFGPVPLVSLPAFGSQAHQLQRHHRLQQFLRVGLEKCLIDRPVPIVQFALDLSLLFH